MKTQVQQLLPKKIKTNTQDSLLQRLNEDFYLESGYNVYIKTVDELDETKTGGEIFIYWYAFSVGGRGSAMHKRIYNVVWGVVRAPAIYEHDIDQGTTIEIVGGCTYNEYDPTRNTGRKVNLMVPAKLKAMADPNEDYILLGSTIRARAKETLARMSPEYAQMKAREKGITAEEYKDQLMKQIELDELEKARTDTMTQEEYQAYLNKKYNKKSNYDSDPTLDEIAASDKNQRDVFTDERIGSYNKFKWLNPNIKIKLLNIIADAIDHRLIAVQNHKKVCKHPGACDIYDPNCSLYYWGKECNIHPEDEYNYKSRLCDQPVDLR